MVLLCKNIVQPLTKVAFRFLKSRNFVKGVVMIIASYALQVLNPIISFTMAMSFFLGRVAYWLTFGVAVSAV